MNITNKELDMAIKEGISNYLKKGPINEGKLDENDVNEVLPLVALGAKWLLKKGAGALAKKGMGALAKNGIKGLAKGGMKNMLKQGAQGAKAYIQNNGKEMLKNAAQNMMQGQGQNQQAVQPAMAGAPVQQAPTLSDAPAYQTPPLQMPTYEGKVSGDGKMHLSEEELKMVLKAGLMEAFSHAERKNSKIKNIY